MRQINGVLLFKQFFVDNGLNFLLSDGAEFFSEPEISQRSWKIKVFTNNGSEPLDSNFLTTKLLLTNNKRESESVCGRPQLVKVFSGNTRQRQRTSD